MDFHGDGSSLWIAYVTDPSQLAGRDPHYLRQCLDVLESHRDWDGPLRWPDERDHWAEQASMYSAALIATELASDVAHRPAQSEHRSTPDETRDLLA
jgi:hypothetical protein